MGALACCAHFNFTKPKVQVASRIYGSTQMDYFLEDVSKFPVIIFLGPRMLVNTLISHASCGTLRFLSILVLYPNNFSLFSGF